MRRLRGGGVTMAVRQWGAQQDKQSKHPVRREGVGIRAVVQGIGGGGVKDRKPQDYTDLEVIEGSRFIGGSPSYTETPPCLSQIQSTTSSTGRAEQALRRQGVWSDRVLGGQPVIGESSRRQAASEGSLLLMVVGSLDDERIQRVSESKGRS